MTAEQTATPAPESATMSDVSLDELAKMAGTTPRTVQRALKRGLIRRCNSRGERPRFTHDEAQRFVSMQESAGASLTLHAPAAAARETDVEAARAEAITGLVSQAQTHNERLYEQTIALLEAVRKDKESTNAALLNEIKRLTEQNGALMQERLDAWKALDEIRRARFDEVKAQADAEIRKSQAAAAIATARELAPALLARFLGGEELKAGAMSKFFESITSEQRDAVFERLFPILTDNQRVQIMALMSEWATAKDAKVSAERKQNGGADAA